MRATAIVPRPGQSGARDRVGAGARRPVIVAFVSGKGGVGSTTTAAGVALALVRGGAGPAAAVSILSGPGSLHHRLARYPGLPLTVVDSGPWRPWSPQGDVVGLAGRLRDGHLVTIVDVGDAQGDPAHRVLARADRIVLVTTPAADAVASAGTALSRVRQVDPARLAAMVVAVVCLGRRQHRWAGQRLRAASRPAGDRTVFVPFDRAVAAAGVPGPGRTRAWPAYQRIAGLLTGAAPASGRAVPR